MNLCKLLQETETPVLSPCTRCTPAASSQDYVTQRYRSVCALHPTRAGGDSAVTDMDAVGEQQPEDGPPYDCVFFFVFFHYYAL